MNFPGYTYEHIHVTEREPDGTYEDCTWASGVEFARAIGQDCPPTRAEYEALRFASGDVATKASPGSNMGDLTRGMEARYGWSGSVARNDSFGLLKVGSAAVVQGSMGAWPFGSHWRRWDPRFAGGHAVAIFKRDALPRVWWCDPLAPSSYSGEWMPQADLIRFVADFPGGQMMYGAIDSRREVAIVDAIKAEDWRAINGNGVFRRRPVRAEVPFARVPDGTIIRSIGEHQGADGNRWRVTEWQGVVAWMLRSDWEPLVPGGDPQVDAQLTAFISRVPDPTPYSAADLEAAKAEARRLNEAKWEQWVATHP